MSLSKPNLVLRVAALGNRDLPDPGSTHLRERLEMIFAALEDSLAALAPCNRALGDPPKGPLAITDYYSSEPPVLRLVSGLADGADQLAADVFWSRPQACVQRELAAIFPFDTATYRNKSPVANTRLFDNLLGHCRHVIELDGCWWPDPAPPDPHEFAKRCRARAYRAQSAVLLRQCDLLISIADPTKPGRAGGARETLHHALALNIPVLFLPTTANAMRFIRSMESLEAGPNEPPNDAAMDELRSLVADIVANPQVARRGPALGKGTAVRDLSPYEAKLLSEYFSEQAYGDTLRGRIWRMFESHFKRERPAKKDLSREPFQQYRKRASELNSHYAGQYRGAFFLNYVLAVLAVALAVFSSSILTGGGGQPRGDGRLWWVLLLDLLKLGVLGAIVFNTRAAMGGGWNDKAIDFRYLAERLRTLFYLPPLAHLRPPSPTVGQYASRVLRQSVIDWMFQAFLRQAPLDQAIVGRSQTTPIRPDVRAGVKAISAHWLGAQAEYHQINANRMTRMDDDLRELGGRLNLVVVGVVAIEVVLLIGAILNGPLSAASSVALEGLGLLFTLLAALLPTAVASLNGVRSQSECERLADRSRMMKSVLQDSLKGDAEKLDARMEKEARTPATDQGSWILEALALADSCAHITVDEVAEWSVLYAKAVPEP